MLHTPGRTGTRCYVPNRGCEMDVRRTKVQFDLGQVVFPYYRCVADKGWGYNTESEDCVE